LSVNDLLSSYSGKKGDEILDFLDSCVNDSLLRLNETGSLPGNIVLPEGTCQIVINSHSGNDWDFTVIGSKDGFTKSIRLKVARGSGLNLQNWQEI
jgi:hypothetical protein